MGDQPQGRSCDSNLPFNLSIDPKVAEVGSLRFIAKFPSSSGEFWFTNTSSKEVVSVLAVVELRDSQGRYMFNMLFHAFEFRAHKRDRSPSSPAYQAERVIQLDEPLMPRKKALWWMSSPYFVTNCPTSARASFVQLQYSDGSTAEHSDPDARREPVALDASTIDLRGAPFALPFETMATIEIDTAGHPSVTDVGSASAGFRQWLQGRVEQWEFSPSFSGATPIPGRLQILFRFHKDHPAQYPMPATLPDSSVFEVADIFPPEPGKSLSRVYLGLSIVSIRGILD